MKFIVICLLFIHTNAFASPFCQEKLTEEMARFLKTQDNKLLSQAFELAQLKLVHKMIQSKGKRATLEDFIKTKIKNISPSKKEELEKEIIVFYKKNGKTITANSASEILHDIENSRYHSAQTRLQDTDNAVVAMILRNIDKDCEKKNDLSCLDESDEAVLWLVGEMKNKIHDKGNAHKNLLDTSVVAANYSGYANPDIFLNSSESAQALSKITKDVEKEFDKLEKEFYQKYSDCLSSLGKDACFKKQAQFALQKELKTLLDKLNSGTLPKLHKRDHEVVLTGIGLKYGLNNSFNLKAKAYKTEEKKKQIESLKIKRLKESSKKELHPAIGMCGGKEFHKEMRNMKTYGMNDIKGGFTDAKDNVKDYRSKGKGSLVEKNNSKDKLKLASKFAIQGPMFRCSPELVKKIPKFAFKTAEQLVCCKENKEWRNLYYFFMNYSGGFSCRGFVGIPYLAEVGVKVGAGINLQAGGGLEPKGCYDQTCFQGAVSFNISAAVYAEALAGLGSLQATISWIPYASLKQCLHSNKAKMPPANLSYKTGNIILIGTAKVGWSVSYDVVRPIYQDEKTTTTDIVIF